MNLILHKNFHRTIIFSNISISGDFRLNNIFQIKKGKKNWLKLKIGHQEFEPIILEFNSDFFTPFYNPNLKKTESPFINYDYYKEIMALLTLVGNANFFRNKKYHLERDILGDEYFKSEFQYLDSKNEIKRQNKHILKKYNVFGETIEFPLNCDDFFNNYFKLKEEKLSRFRMSLMLYYNSIDINEHSPSMSFVALISAIENLVDFDSKMNNISYDKCKSCNQTQFKVTRRFKDFMIKYCSSDTPKFKKYLDKVYSKRSNITHIGELLYYDYARSELDFKGANEIDTLKTFVRLALYNWVIKN